MPQPWLVLRGAVRSQYRHELSLLQLPESATLRQGSRPPGKLRPGEVTLPAKATQPEVAESGLELSSAPAPGPGLLARALVYQD